MNNRFKSKTNFVAILKEFVILNRQVEDLKNLILLENNPQKLLQIVGNQLTFAEFEGLLQNLNIQCKAETARRVFNSYEQKEKGYLDESDLKLMILPCLINVAQLPESDVADSEQLIDLFEMLIDVASKQRKCLQNYKIDAEEMFKYLSQGRLQITQNEIKLFMRCHGVQLTQGELFFVQGKCRDGDQCKFSHDTQNVEKVDLERNEQGKLIIRGGRGKQMRPSNNNNVDSDRWERNKNNDEEPKQFRGRGDDRRKTYDRGDDRRKTYDRNQHYGDDEQQNFKKFNKSHQNKEDFQKFNNDDGDKNQSDSVPKINRGRGRGRGNEDRDQDKNDQFQRNGRFERNIKNDRNQNERDQNDNQKNDQFSKGERFDRNANRGVRNFRNNRPDRLDRIERSENFGADNQDEKPTETQPYLKKVKKNDVEVKKKAMVLKLEQKLDCDNFVQIIGYHYQFLGILKQQSIQFYSIPFKRARMDIIDEDEKVEIVHRDKRFIKGWVQEVQQNNFTLIVQFENEGENTKNLMIFENVFKQQCPIIINDIGLKELVYVVVDDDQLLTFCKDGFIRIFQQQQIDRQYKYTLHFNFDQSIESVIQVGSNYLIGARQNKLYIFNGKQAKEIPYKFDQKCTSMSLDYNRVILKLESDLESSIYILNQNLEIFGPIYKQNNFACFEIIKNYENEKLYLLCQNQSLETFIEIDNKLYPVNVLLNQSLTDIKKIEITNENMVTQKFIIGYQQNELKIFSIVPEQ